MYLYINRTIKMREIYSYSCLYLEQSKSHKSGLMGNLTPFVCLANNRTGVVIPGSGFQCYDKVFIASPQDEIFLDWPMGLLCAD